MEGIWALDSRGRVHNGGRGVEQEVRDHISEGHSSQGASMMENTDVSVQTSCPYSVVSAVKLRELVMLKQAASGEKGLLAVCDRYAFDPTTREAGASRSWCVQG